MRNSVSLKSLSKGVCLFILMCYKRCLWNPQATMCMNPIMLQTTFQTVQLICILFSQIMSSLGWSCIANLIGINTFQTDNLTRPIFILISWPKVYQMEWWPKKLVTQILGIPSKNVLWLNYTPTGSALVEISKEVFFTILMQSSIIREPLSEFSIQVYRPYIYYRWAAQI